MNDIESIVLTYENRNRIQYQYYAEFFRFIGVYVCENLYIAETSGKDFDSSKFSFSIEYEVKDGEKADKNTLLEIFKSKFGETQVWQSELIDIFDKNSLLQASVTLQYFKTKDVLLLDVKKKFKNAADSLVELVKNKPEYLENRYVRYAKLYCKQKANDAQFLYDKSIVYYVDDLATEGLTILKTFPDFSNVWVLLGMIYEISKDFGRDAIDAFQRGIEDVKQMPFTSSIYYWLGKQCGKYMALESMADNAFKEAYALMKKYRNIYKIAQIHYRKKEWKETLFYFKECIQMIERKENFLDPLEQEYYFKVCIQIANIYLKLEEYENVIKMVNKALELRKGIFGGLENSNLYTEFYFKIYTEEEAKAYIRLELKRMRAKQAYQYLAIAYQELGIQEKC